MRKPIWLILALTLLAAAALVLFRLPWELREQPQLKPVAAPSLQQHELRREPLPSELSDDLIREWLREIALSDHSYSPPQIKEIRFEIVRRPFSPRGDSLFIIGDVEMEWWKQSTTVILALLNRGEGYERVFQWSGANKSFGVRPQFVDLNADGWTEFVLEYDQSGNQSTWRSASVYWFDGTLFREVWTEGLSECYILTPYAYENTYRFVEGPQEFKDIELTVNAGPDPELLLESSPNPYASVEIPSYRGTVLYRFRDGRYRPVTETIPYRKWFEEHVYGAKE